MSPVHSGTEYVSALAQMWAAVEPRQQWSDQGCTQARTLEELVDDFLDGEDPYPVATAVFAARWKPGQWGLGQIIGRTDFDEWDVVFIDGSGKVSRDHSELYPAL